VKTEYGVIIIGSGITASVFRNNLEDYYDCLTINPQIVDGKYEFTQVQGTFSPAQAEKGDSLNGHGAAEHWGGAITWPSESNYFKGNLDENWADFHKFISHENLNKKYGLQEKRKSRSKSIFLPSSVSIEKHDYLGGSRGRVPISTHNIVSKFPHISAEVLGINKGERFELTLQEIGTNRIEKKVIHSDYIVLAAGPLLNPLFFSMLTGKKKFEYGNHLSLTSHIIEFQNIQILSDWCQTYNQNEKSFLTCVPSAFLDKCDEISFRIRPKEILSKKIALIEILKDRERKLKFKLEFIFEILKPIISRRQIAKLFTIDLMVNQDPSFGSSLMIDDSYPTKKVHIVARTSEECLNLIERLICELDALIENISNGHNKVKSFERISKESLRDFDTFRDAAHWYGTMPMHKDSGLISSNFESKSIPNLFAIGASGFAEGSVAHPTLLAIYTAEKASQELIRRYSE
jgi:hypothetical protein